MSDNKNFEEEYQYVEEPEFEPIDVEVEPQVQASETAEKTKYNSNYAEKISSMIREPSIKRNAFIAVLALFFILTLLKCAGRPAIQHESMAPQPIAEKKSSQFQANVAPISTQDNQLQNLLEMQKNMQNNLATMNEKMNQLNAQLNSLNANNQMLQQQLGQMVSKLQSMQQSMAEAVAAAKARPQIKKTIRSSEHGYRPMMPKIHYYVQAIIPGRAWLVNSQGKTITLRVGSSLAGYGIVKAIDAQQGRVLMSTGKIFVFNPAD